MSTHLELFYALRLRKCIHCMFMFTFSVFFANIFFFYPEMGPITFTTSLGPRKPESNGNEGALYTLLTSRNWSPNIRCSIVSYTGHSLGRSYSSVTHTVSVFFAPPTGKVIFSKFSFNTKSTITIEFPNVSLKIKSRYDSWTLHRCSKNNGL